MKKKTLILIFALIFHCINGYCYTNDEAIRAIIGEASNQGRRGMLAVACAIRNRNTLKGVYGLKAKHVDNEPEWVWNMARQVWEESKNMDITNGATHWHNLKREGKVYWIDDMNKVYEYKDHIFYKEK